MFFLPKSLQQVAALPYVPIGPAIEVLLVTSKRRRRWILPKGWPSKHFSLPQSAAREAEEEAGVVGSVRTSPIGSYTYTKAMPTGYSVPCHVFVYPLLVRQHHLSWRERGQREIKWTTLASAARLVDDRELGRLLEQLAQSDGESIHAFADAIEDTSARASTVQ